MITISVPSKVHLLGEHAVVYGRPAILAAIDKRISVTISSSKRKQLSGVYTHKEIKRLLGILEREIQKQTKIKKIKPYSIKITSQVPIGVGLGSSASLSASMTAALLSFLEIPWDKKSVFDIAYKGEKFFHGNPSGGDLAAVLEGGILWFRKEFEFLKTFASLPFQPHKNIKNFILINSGKPKESTKEMVKKVSQLKRRFPQRTKMLFDLQEALTKEMVVALRDGDEHRLIKCIRLGERNLKSLGVVGEKSQFLIRTIEILGGAAKITGAGGVKEGSGMILVYHKDPNKLLTDLTAASGRILQLNDVDKKNPEVITIRIGEEGLKVHE